MACITTNVQLANLIKEENLENKSFLELGYLKNENVLDLKKTLLKQGTEYYRTNKEQVDGTDFVWEFCELSLLISGVLERAPALQQIYDKAFDASTEKAWK